MTTDKSAPKVNLSLDDLEKENPKEPYRTSLRGRVIELADPQDIDWLELMDIEDDPARFIVLCMSDDDARFFMDEPVPSWKINKLMDAFMQHYGLGARGKGRGLRR